MLEQADLRLDTALAGKAAKAAGRQHSVAGHDDRNGVGAAGLAQSLARLQLQRLDAAREAVAADLKEIVRLRLEEADTPDVFKVKRYPAGDATAERSKLERESANAMAVFRQLRVMQGGVG